MQRKRGWMRSVHGKQKGRRFRTGLFFFNPIPTSSPGLSGRSITLAGGSTVWMARMKRAMTVKVEQEKGGADARPF
jgi:hypothetical protein